MTPPYLTIGIMFKRQALVGDAAVKRWCKDLFRSSDGWKRDETGDTHDAERQGQVGNVPLAQRVLHCRAKKDTVIKKQGLTSYLFCSDYSNTNMTLLLPDKWAYDDCHIETVVGWSNECWKQGGENRPDKDRIEGRHSISHQLPRLKLKKLFRRDSVFRTPLVYF